MVVLINGYQVTHHMLTDCYLSLTVDRINQNNNSNVFGTSK